MPYIFIDWSKRINKQNTNSNDFYISFNSQLRIKNYIKLLYLLIPKTVYLINSKNNTFNIIFNDNTVKNITIPINNYDTDTLATTIKNLINYSSFNMVLNDDFTYTLSASQNFIINFNSNLNILFNLEKNKDYNSVWNVFKTNIINFNYPLFINLNFVDFETWNFYKSDNSTTSFIIPFNIERFGLMNYNKNIYEQINYFWKEYNLNTFHIRLLDENNDLIDLNNSDFQILLEFD